jgi:hypothetical protein
VRRAKPPRNDAAPPLLQKARVQVLEVSEIPSGKGPGWIRATGGESLQKPLSPAQRWRVMQRVFRPLALELGWIVFEWNRLHEALCDLLQDVSSDSELASAVWHSTTNERTQRDMLSNALASITDLDWRPQARDDIRWLLKKVGALSGRRNNAIHAPLIFAKDAADADSAIRIEPLTYSGNQRALELAGKPLLREFRWYRDHLGRLAQFAENIHWTRIADDIPWPDKPQLPPIGEFPTEASRRPRKRNK